MNFTNRVIFVAAVLVLCLFGVGFAANFPLKIIQPYPGLDNNNRYYRAYPGIEYNVGVHVIRGAYPYTYSLTTAPSGMTIGASTGTISWPNPTTVGSPHTVTAKVIDAEGTQDNVTWTIAVQTTGFYFIDSVNGLTVAGGGTGTLANPWKTIGDMWEGTGSGAVDNTGTSYAYGFVYYRTGVYNTADGFLISGENRLMVHYGNKPHVWMAYPGETPQINVLNSYIYMNEGHSNYYFEGLTFDNVSNNSGVTQHALKFLGVTSNVTVRNNTFKNMPLTSGSQNQSFVMFGGDTPSEPRIAVVGNTFDNLDHGYAALFYGVDNGLVANNTITNFGPTDASTHGIGVKCGNTGMDVRSNAFSNYTYGDPLWDGGCNTTRATGNNEYRYNNVKVSGASGTRAFALNNEMQTHTGPTYFYRNTIVGGVPEIRQNTGAGPIYLDNNVIVNEMNAGIYPNKAWLNPVTPLITTFANELLGAAADNIVDSNGNLTAGYAGYVGNRGYQLGADTTPNAFSLGPDNTAVELNTVIYAGTSANVAGIDNNCSIAISGTGCEYRVNAGSWITSGDNVVLNDNVAVRTTSANAYSTSVSCTLTLGGSVSDSWAAVTKAASVQEGTAKQSMFKGLIGGCK